MAGAVLAAAARGSNTPNKAAAQPGTPTTPQQESAQTPIHSHRAPFSQRAGGILGAAAPAAATAAAGNLNGSSPSSRQGNGAFGTPPQQQQQSQASQQQQGPDSQAIAERILSHAEAAARTADGASSVWNDVATLSQVCSNAESIKCLLCGNAHSSVNCAGMARPCNSCSEVLGLASHGIACRVGAWIPVM